MANGESLPSDWLYFHPENATFIAFNPPIEINLTINLTATDPFGSYAMVSFNFLVTNEPPFKISNTSTISICKFLGAASYQWGTILHELG